MYFAQSLLIITYFIPVVLLLIFAGNLYFMILLYLRTLHRGRDEATSLNRRFHEQYSEEDLPLIATQLPVYNECNVVERAIRAIAAMDYPLDRHEIQVLDDSNDETCTIIDRVAAELLSKGHRIHVIRRSNREGYKAGALENGLRHTEAEFIALFDADFVPPGDFLRRMIPILLLRRDVGFAQARWGHLDGDQNWLTKIQCIGLDGHFGIEQPARAWNSCFMNFNGTAGLWRREAIHAGGGWEHDTLTEDMDLSYRAQLKGWKPFFVSDLAVPAEVPGNINAFKSQQFRWAKGSIQTAIKLLPRVIRSGASPLAKIQAVFHMTHYLTHPLLLMMIMLALPVLLFTPFREKPVLIWLFVSIVATGTLAPITLYITSQRVLYPGNKRARLRNMPLLTLVGIGMTLSNTCAVIEAIMGRSSEFVRTPKQGQTSIRHYACKGTTAAVVELGIGVYCYISMFLYLTTAKAIVTPFLFLYATGFTLVGLVTLRDTLVGSRKQVEEVKPDAEPVSIM